MCMGAASCLVFVPQPVPFSIQCLIQSLLYKILHNEHIITYGIQANDATIEYSNWLITTMNTVIPDETWRFPSPHPCTLIFSDIPQSSLQTAYQSLVNCLQRHTQQCLLLPRRKNNPEPACRVVYLMECTAESSISFEKPTNGQIKARLTTKKQRENLSRTTAPSNHNS